MQHWDNEKQREWHSGVVKDIKHCWHKGWPDPLPVKRMEMAKERYCDIGKPTQQQVCIENCIGVSWIIVTILVESNGLFQIQDGGYIN